LATLNGCPGLDIAADGKEKLPDWLNVATNASGRCPFFTAHGALYLPYGNGQAIDGPLLSATWPV